MKKEKEIGKGKGSEKNYTYVVQCCDGTYYTGWTSNLEKRIETHNKKKGAKYTRSRVPIKLMYYEIFETKKEAMQREYQIKQMTRKQKEKLIQNCLPLFKHDS